MSAAKRAVGRPMLFGKPTERKTVHLPPPVIAQLTMLGDGSLSRGIVLAARKVKS
jgi:hypothetical protein